MHNWFSPAQVFAVIRANPCFAGNSNAEVRAQIRAEIPFAPERLMATNRKHQSRHDGAYFRTLDIIDRQMIARGELRIVRRFHEQHMERIAACLAFACPLCDGTNGPKRFPFYHLTDERKTFVCLECWRPEHRQQQVRHLEKLARLLSRGKTDEEYSRVEERSDSGFDRVAQWGNQPSGSTDAGVSREKHHRHLEGGNSLSGDVDGQFQSGASLAARAASRRQQIILAMLSEDSR
jgi:hypothetical protein